MPGVVACTYNPATTEAEFRNDVGAVAVGGNSPSTGRLSNQLYVISARRKIWLKTGTQMRPNKWTEIPSRAKLATTR